MGNSAILFPEPQLSTFLCICNYMNWTCFYATYCSEKSKQLDIYLGRRKGPFNEGLPKLVKFCYHLSELGRQALARARNYLNMFWQACASTLRPLGHQICPWYTINCLLFAMSQFFHMSNWFAQINLFATKMLDFWEGYDISNKMTIYGIFICSQGVLIHSFHGGHLLNKCPYLGSFVYLPHCLDIRISRYLPNLNCPMTIKWDAADEFA